MRISTVGVLAAALFTAVVSGWEKEDHEIFRLRDEVAAAEGSEVTFYDFIGVKSQASQDEITKAYRKKSRNLHPDKAKQQFIASRSSSQKKKSGEKTKKKPGVKVTKPPTDSEIRSAVKKASDRYARLTVVADILRGPQRQRYDHFMKNGFPMWRGTGYYYSRYRPGLGTVLMGLFLVVGGGAHYGAMYLGWKRQREFVGRYVRHARRAAWGDEVGIKGIPGVDGGPGASNAGTGNGQKDEVGMQGLNRKQRRMQEKESKRKTGRDDSANGEAKVLGTTPSGERKKVVAENGKVLIVDSTGNVFLEEENEDGETEEYLLDVDEIPRPTIQQTVLFRLPVWAYDQTVGRAIASVTGPSKLSLPDGIPEGIEITTDEEPRVNGNANGKKKRR